MKYEFYKIISYKYYHFVLFSITVITALLCFYSSLSSQVYMSRESLSSDIQQLHEDYLLNLDILNSDAISNSDKNHIKTNIYRNSEYQSAIQNLLQSTRIKINNNEISGNSQNNKYLETVYTKYSELLNSVEIGFEDYRGWDVFISCSWPAIMTLLLHALIAGMFFVNEHSIHALLKPTKKGIINISWTKICFIALHILGIFILYTIMDILIVSSTIGLSNPFNAIQSFEKYTYCEYNISLIGMTVMIFIERYILVFVIVLAFCLFSCFIKNHIAILSTEAIFFLLQLFLQYSNKNRNESFIYLFNMFSLIDGDIFLNRYYEFSILGQKLPATHLYIVMSIISISILIWMLVVLFNKFFFFDSVFTKVKSRFHFLYGKGNRHKHINITLWELRKIWHKGTIIFFTVIIIIQAIYCYSTFSIEHSGEDKVWQTYLKELEGTFTEEKHAYVEAEYQYINEIIPQYDTYYNDYKNEIITYEEFEQYIDQYTYADARKGVIDRLLEYSRYLQALSKTREVSYVYDTGWISYHTIYMDLLLLVFIIYISISLYSVDVKQDNQTSEMASLLCPTLNGRSKLIRCKLNAILLSSIIVATTQIIFNYMICDMFWYLPWENTSIDSIQYFSGISHLSVWGYFVFICINKMLLSCFCGLFSFALYRIIKKSAIVYVVVSLILCVPLLGMFTPLHIFNYFSPLIIYEFTLFVELIEPNNLYRYYMVTLVLAVLFVIFSSYRVMKESEIQGL